MPLELTSVAGIGFALDGSLAFIDATLNTPEPATLALVGFGLLAAAAIRRRPVGIELGTTA